MLINLHSIIIDKPIPGLTGVTFNRCTTLADVLAAIITQGGADIHAVSGHYDPATENIVITLSNNSTFSISAALLLPVVADGQTITGNGASNNQLVGYKVAYNAQTGALTITPPGAPPINVPAQMAATEPAADTHNLLGLGGGAAVTTQQMLDHLAAHLRDCCPGDMLEIPASAFADPVNPTQIEAQAWIDHQGALKAGTQIIYNRFVSGDVEEPDYVWLVNEIGDATNLKAPFCIIQTTSASVINPITGINTWTSGTTQQTPITTITVTNPTNRVMSVQLAVFHGLYVRNSLFESPKVQTLSAESTIEFDNGAGSLTALGSNPPYVGNNQLSAIAPASDTGQSNNAGIQVHTTNLLYRTIAPNTTVTYRARATATIRDGGTGNIWTYTNIGIFAVA